MMLHSTVDGMLWPALDDAGDIERTLNTLWPGLACFWLGGEWEHLNSSCDFTSEVKVQ